MLWRSRAQSALLWAVPAVFCLALYWPGLSAWFQMDDFAWLGLARTLRGPGDLPRALFAPMAQGTVRTLSERLFFLVFHALFGLWAGPYRVWVFATQLANLVLLGAIAARLTRSKLAAWLAPVFWTASTGLALPMAWTAA